MAKTIERDIVGNIGGEESGRQRQVSNQKVAGAMADAAQNNMTGQFPDFPAVPTHGGQFVQYNIFGSQFEVTSKYRPPVMPIGRGAYGIVW